MKNLLISLLCTTTLTIFSNSVKASMFDKAAFVDTFDDGIFNTNVYSPIGNAIVSESNGVMTVQASGGEGISVSFDDVVSESNWMGFEFDTSGFSASQGISIRVVENNSLSQEFTSLLITLEPVLSVDSSEVSTNQVKKDLKGTYTIFDQQGNPILDPNTGMPFMQTWPRALEVPANGTWRVFLDWDIDEENNTKRWIIDWEMPLLPDNLKKVILNNAEMGINKGRGKRIDLTVTSGDDPTFTFRQIAADPVPQHTPESTSTITLFSLGIIGVGTTIKRKVKCSHSIKKESTKVG